MNQELISIVIPIYDIQEYLKSCIDSVIVQTYANLEIILVDDGSPDDSPRICDEYAKKDGRIKVIHKKNGGLSAARNAGLKAAKGEYVAFIDGDDYIASNFIEVLYKTCKDTGADISCTSFYRVYSGKLVAPYKKSDAQSFNNLEAIRDIFTAHSLCEVMTWNKLYRRTLFADNDIEFPVGKLHEDNFTTYKLLYFAHTIAFVNQPLYYYIQRDDSIMGRLFNERRLGVFEMFDEARDFFASKGVVVNNELQSSKLLSTLGLLNDYVVSDISNQHIESVLRRELKRMRHVVLNREITKKHKIMYLLARLGLTPYRIGRRLYLRYGEGVK